MKSVLLDLRKIPLDEVAGLQSTPSLKIRTDDDVEYWKTTQSYLDYGIFLRRLNESVVGYTLPWEPVNRSTSITKILELLDELAHWVDDIPALQTPQRFGNIAFRTWGQRLEERCDNVLQKLLAPDFLAVLPYVKPYLLISFGSFTRMDYGSGHETSFALFLLCLTLVRFFEPEPAEERDLVLSVFLRYLKLCWKLQDTYKLEPAGSHGVWGLDDYCFLPYIFGSGQLRDQTEIPVSAVLQPPLPPTNLYFMSIMRIHDVKYGPFHEHSSQLHSIAAGVPNWGKVNTGLFKMFEAEVLGKRVVVQHIPLGGLLEWENPENKANSIPVQSAVTSQHTIRSHPSVSTPAPWASANNTVGLQHHIPGQTMLPPSLSQHNMPKTAIPSNRQSRGSEAGSHQSGPRIPQ
ncbi:Serine/threonine-protein phosphatase 2A activator 1 [Psilocybe cubensis]|uniref:Serine/threonine-protein phosphatase 2A activator 1 n=2 Tax=Psilocybe cubensis TaxID=181762 RepID=A0ACB8H326_PSICU|nr:Serine/threonine-protein phosphatase 2A activator 1 [Psilocybe cubensis]KAH9481901.1 Serine/threonine-protein phosphatase 2A activator 1 [Psilocybe cubensis]